MKNIPNKFIKQNNDLFNLEEFNRRMSMVWCPEKKELVDERCKGCIFYNPEKTNWCIYDSFSPGLKKGREWK